MLEKVKALSDRCVLTTNRSKRRKQRTNNADKVVRNMSKTALRLVLLCATLGIGATAAGKLPFGPWRRASDAPILSPAGTGWESAGTFNPAVIEYGGKFVMLYRAQDRAGT